MRKSRQEKFSLSSFWHQSFDVVKVEKKSEEKQRIIFNKVIEIIKLKTKELASILTSNNQLIAIGILLSQIKTATADNSVYFYGNLGRYLWDSTRVGSGYMNTILQACEASVFYPSPPIAPVGPAVTLCNQDIVQALPGNVWNASIDSVFPCIDHELCSSSSALNDPTVITLIVCACVVCVLGVCCKQVGVQKRDCCGNGYVEIETRPSCCAIL